MRGEEGKFFFTLIKHTIVVGREEICKGFGKKGGDIFLGQKAFIMLQRRKKNMQILHILPLNIMKNHMERVFLH